MYICEDQVFTSLFMNVVTVIHSSSVLHKSWNGTVFNSGQNKSNNFFVKSQIFFNSGKWLLTDTYRLLGSKGIVTKTEEYDW